MENYQVISSDDVPVCVDRSSRSQPETYQNLCPLNLQLWTPTQAHIHAIFVQMSQMSDPPLSNHLVPWATSVWVLSTAWRCLPRSCHAKIAA